MSETPKVLSLEDVRARIAARKQQGVDLSQFKTFEHSGLGGDLYYGALPSFAIERYENIAQFYPLDHPVVALRGLKSSTPELDALNRMRLVLKQGVRMGNGAVPDDDIVEFLLNDAHCGKDNRKLQLLILHETYSDEELPSDTSTNTIAAFTRWEAAFHDLLVKSGWVEHWVEYVTSSDDSTPEAKEAAIKLAKIEEAAPEWAKRMQADELIKALAETEE